MKDTLTCSVGHPCTVYLCRPLCSLQCVKLVLFFSRSWMEDCLFSRVCESRFVLDLFVNRKFSKRIIFLFLFLLFCLLVLFYFNLEAPVVCLGGWQSAGWNQCLKEVASKKALCNNDVFRKTTGNKMFIASLNVCLYIALSGSSYFVCATLVFNFVLSRKLQ